MKMEIQELKDRFDLALNRFIEDERDLLIRDINEETITTEFKAYLKSVFDDWPWNIDHLWDDRIVNNEIVSKRIIIARDSLPIKKIPQKYQNTNEEEIYKLIKPDLIFHDRHSNEHNFIVIEVKLSTNKNQDDRTLDRVKLEVMTSADLQYEWGVFIDLKSGAEFNEESPYQINFITNGEWQEI